MAKKLVQFQIAEKIREEIETYSKDKDMTLSELLRQSVRLFMIINEYSSMGYKIFLRKDETNSEKEIILP